VHGGTVEGTRRKVAGANPECVTGIFHRLNSPDALWHWVESASNINEYQGYLLEVNTAGA